VERAELLDLLDGDGGVGLDAELGGVVVEGDVLDSVGLDGPVEFVAEIGDELREGLDAPEAFERRGHGGGLEK